VVSNVKKRIMRSVTRMRRMDKLATNIGLCHRCIRVLFPTAGIGSPVADTVIIGQSLHGYCLLTPRRQIPFIGPMEEDSGDVLYNAIDMAGVDPLTLYITNVVKCHPPGNRPNLLEEEKKCFHFLVSELRIIRPRVVITLGRQAEAAIKRRVSIKRPRSFGSSKLSVAVLRTKRKKPRGSHSFCYVCGAREAEPCAADCPSREKKGKEKKPLSFGFTAVSHPAYAMRQGSAAICVWQEEFSDLLKAIGE